MGGGGDVRFRQSLFRNGAAHVVVRNREVFFDRFAEMAGLDERVARDDGACLEGQGETVDFHAAETDCSVERADADGIEIASGKRKEVGRMEFDMVDFQVQLIVAAGEFKRVEFFSGTVLARERRGNHFRRCSGGFVFDDLIPPVE